MDSINRFNEVKEVAPPAPLRYKDFFDVTNETSRAICISAKPPKELRTRVKLAPGKTIIPVLVSAFSKTFCLD